VTLRPPSSSQRARELLLGRDIARFIVNVPALAALPKNGDGRPVVLVPGFGADDASLIPLRRFLARRRHDVYPSGLGRVGDDVMALASRVATRVRSVSALTGQRVSIVGWSIGGVLAREAARDNPDVVARVITMGTPVEGGPSYTALASRYPEAMKAGIRALIEERHRVDIAVPVTALWSENDGIVLPAACIDHRTPGAENVQVSCTHLGFGVDPTVFRIVADRLARTADRPTNTQSARRNANAGGEGTSRRSSV
jgi:hypothetical protein